MNLHTNNSNPGALRRELPAAAVTTIGFLRIFRMHVKDCPFRNDGARHIDCTCPIYLADHKDVDGKRVNQRSLHTRDWQQAQERVKAIEKGVPVETIGGMGKLYRKHAKTCPFHRDGVRHIDCNCVIWMHGYKQGAARRVGHIFTRSLRTRDWQQAKERLAAIESGAPVETVKGLARLYRHHDKLCPFRKLGRSHIDCNCPVYISGCRDGDGNRISSRSLRTRSWQQAKARLAAISDPEELARKLEEERSAERSSAIRLRPLLTFMRQTSGVGGICRLGQTAIAEALGLNVFTVIEQLRELIKRGQITVTRRGRRNVYDVASIDLEVPSGSPPQNGTTRTNRGRETAPESQRIIKRYVEMGEPAILDAKITGELAKIGYPKEFAKAKPGLKKHKNLLDRAGNAIRRYKIGLTKKPLS